MAEELPSTITSINCHRDTRALQQKKLLPKFVSQSTRLIYLAPKRRLASFFIAFQRERSSNLLVSSLKFSLIKSAAPKAVLLKESTLMLLANCVIVTATRLYRFPIWTSCARCSSSTDTYDLGSEILACLPLLD